MVRSKNDYRAGGNDARAAVLYSTKLCLRMRSVSPPCRTCRTPRSNSGQPLQHMLRVFRDMHMHRFSRTLLPIHLDIQEQHAGRKGSLRSTALRSSTRTLSLPSVFRGLGPAEISQPEDLNRRESRGGAYQSSLELRRRVLSSSRAAACLSSSGPGTFRSARTCQTTSSSNQALRSTSLVEPKRW